MEEQIKNEEKVANNLEPLSDILLVLDKVKNRIEAVKGIDADGNLETVQPKKKNLLDFIRIDKGDMFSNFFSNFWRNLNDPSGYKFFKVSGIDMETVAKKLQSAIDNPTPEGNRLLDALEVKHDHHINKQQMETKRETQQENYERNPDYKFEADRIDWDTAQKFGITRELLEKTGQLDKLLRGYKTDRVFSLAANVDGAPLKADARLGLREVDDKIQIMLNGVRYQPDLDSKFYGHKFSEEDKENLLKTGNMGRVVELTNYRDGSQVRSLISLDKFTKEPVSYPQEWVKISDEFGGVKLSKEQKAELLEGRAVLVEGMKNAKTGEFFNQILQFNADERKLVFTGNSQTLGKTLQQGEIPDEFRGRDLTEKDKEMLKEGEVIYLKDLVNKEGTKLYSGYLWLNKEQGSLDFDFKNPRVAQSDQHSTVQDTKLSEGSNANKDLKVDSHKEMEKAKQTNKVATAKPKLH